MEENEVGTWAMVENGVIVNLVLWNGDVNTWTPPEGIVMVPYDETEYGISIGWLWDGENFYPPEEEN